MQLCGLRVAHYVQRELDDIQLGILGILQCYDFVAWLLVA